MSEFANQRRTKIVATIGPASDTPGVLRDMVAAGMDVVRISLAHGSLEQALDRFRQVRQVSSDCGVQLGIMIDLPGPKLRAGKFPDDGLLLQRGEAVRVVPGEESSASGVIRVDYANLLTDVKVGDHVAFGDGQVVIEIRDQGVDGFVGEVLHGGRLQGRPGVVLPAERVRLKFPTTEDLRFLDAFVECGTDMVAASLVESADDIRALTTVAHPDGPMIVAKIETRRAVDNLPEIIEVSGAVMIARGDLGIHCAIEELPHLQKRIIGACVQYGRPMITATQMLESMVSAPTPTRAEASDIANAVFDGTSAVMLSGETAIGHDPALAVRTMARIARFADEQFDALAWGERVRGARLSGARADDDVITDTVTSAAWRAAIDLDAAAIICWSESGNTVRSMARFRPRSALIGISPNPRTVRQLSLSWGVAAFEAADVHTESEAAERGIEIARQAGHVSSGDAVVVVSGSARPGRRISDSLRLLRVP